VNLLSHSPRESTPLERQYIANTSDGSPAEPRDLIFVDSPASLEFSVMIPCYNETKRLPVMLEECVPILQELFGDSWEILLVDDGSTDGSAEFALSWALSHNVKPGKLRVSKLERNRGKGGAVTHGMKYVRGKYAMFADADGASNFNDVRKLLKAIDDCKLGIAIGSRAHLMKTDAVVKRSFIRNFLMYGLHTLLYVFGIRTIADTQCGFKLFTRDALQLIFPFMHTEGWIFDVEVLIIAMKKNIPIYEVPISWHEVEGSKIELARDSFFMALDLVIMRVAYLLGIYNEFLITSRHDRERSMTPKVD
jgi:dolichyl-phosphate beta-glucosyltransferase